MRLHAHTRVRRTSVDKVQRKHGGGDEGGGGENRIPAAKNGGGKEDVFWPVPCNAIQAKIRRGLSMHIARERDIETEANGETTEEERKDEGLAEKPIVVRETKEICILSNRR